MRTFKDYLIEERKYLEEIVNDMNSDTAVYPEGSLSISVSENSYRAYQTYGGNKIYIPSANIELMQALAQKCYNIHVLRLAQRRLKQIKQILNEFDEDEIDNIFYREHSFRQQLIVPVRKTWKQRLKEWESTPVSAGAIYPNGLVFQTERGEWVRSKSEKILADYFYSHNIPYKYEIELRLDNGIIVHPDFAFLSKRLRKEIYWEHMGKMDDPEYSDKCVMKINDYIESGIMPGERLILTFETKSETLSTNIIKALVNKYLI